MRFVVLMLAAAALSSAAESDALRISANIQARHMPFGTIVDPIYVSVASDQITGYTRCGDSAIWTGHYLAAESYRYKVTRDPQALKAIRGALAGLKALVDVTGTNLLARCMIPIDSPYAAGIMGEESHNGVYISGHSFWIGNTSRDQYSGAVFGLVAAYDLVDAPEVRSSARDLITRMLQFVIAKAWNIVMPNGAISTTFLLRPDQQLSLLQAGAHVNAKAFAAQFKELESADSAVITIPVGFDVLDVHDSYFKFNLDYINFFNLIHLDARQTGDRVYRRAYASLRQATHTHGNAFFNAIDRALNGPEPARDAETAALLNAWLRRPTRDVTVDLRGVYPSCGSAGEACNPIPVEQRVPSDFLWQRSPFQLTGGGSGLIESAGIDYILPYWMGRYYQVAGI